MVTVDALQDAIDLGLEVVAARFEALRQVTQHGDPIGAGRRDGLEVPILEEACLLGRPFELLDAPLIALLQHNETVRRCVLGWARTDREGDRHDDRDDRARQGRAPLSERIPKRVQIVEVSPRDGLQAETRTLPTETKLELITRLAEAGHTVIEATSFVNPKAVPQLADAEELLRALKRRPGVRYPVLVPNERGLDRALSAGADEIAVFASASESYSRKNLNHSRDEVIDGYRTVVRRAKDGKLRVRGYLSMVIADPWDGPTKPAVVVDCAKRLLAMGCDELSLGDTSGVGTPGEVRALLRAFKDAGIANEKIALHLHDTYGQALANALTALELGITTFDASVGGVGGSPFAKMAAGNLATEDLVWMCNGLGIETGLDVAKLAQTSAWMSEQLGRELPGRVAHALTQKA